MLSVWLQRVIHITGKPGVGLVLCKTSC